MHSGGPLLCWDALQVTSIAMQEFKYELCGMPLRYATGTRLPCLPACPLASRGCRLPTSPLCGVAAPPRACLPPPASAAQLCHQPACLAA
jgi:hypothetical protein